MGASFATFDPPLQERLYAVNADDCYRLRYRLWEGPTSRGTVVLLHGVMSHSDWLGSLASPLASSGFKVIVPDRRGSGLNHVRRGDAPTGQMLVRDLWRIIEREHDNGVPLIIAGWCWGAVLALNATVDTAKQIDGLIFLAPGLFPSQRVEDAIGSQRRLAANRPPSKPCIASPIREEMFTKGPWLENFILRDDLRLRSFTPRFDAIMQKMSLVSAVQLRRLTQPMLLVLAERDVTVDNNRTLEAFGRVTKAPLDVRVLDCHHGMQFEAPEELAGEVSGWLKRHHGLDDRRPRRVAEGA